MSDHKNGSPCRCAQELIDRFKAQRKVIVGLAVVLLPDGTETVGNVAIVPPVLVGSQPKRILVAYRYCPFCGGELPRSSMLPDAAADRSEEK